jgi:hypothetical protein
VSRSVDVYTVYTELGIRENQYHDQFKKRWRWDRNQKSEDWRAVAYIVHDYERKDIPWQAFKDGVPYDQSKVLAKIAPWKTEKSYSSK